MQCRAGEAEKNWFRSDRTYNLSGKWFFTTREGDEVGPFSSTNQAEKEIKVFLECLKKDGLLAAEYNAKIRSQAGSNKL